MTASRPIYFDNAATTYPKPESVLCATEQCMRYYCGNAGRGGHALAMKSAETVYEAREGLARLFGGTPEGVVFTLNTTYALNMAIKGVMSGGGHLLISNMEHNSVLRPVAELARRKRITYDVFEVYRKGSPVSPREMISSIMKRLRPDTRAVVCIHSSNICSYSLPVAEIGALCRRLGLTFIVDAAQSAGHLPIDMERDGIDVLCMPAHKGLYAPQGLGIMMLGEGVTLDTLIEGGNGVNSLELGMGSSAPERYEGGTLCTPAIAGLCASLKLIDNLGIERIASMERALWRRAYGKLNALDGVEIYDLNEGGVLLFNVSGMHAGDTGRALGSRGFCLRDGYHCSPLAHKALGTPEGGAVRLSLGIFNTEDEVDALCLAVSELAESRS